MEINHKSLGKCKLLLHFEGKKNQMALVTCYKTYDLDRGVKDSWIFGRKGSYSPQKPQHWMLWSALDQPIEEAGITKLETDGLRNQRQTPATKRFLQATKFIDELTITKIKKF